MLLVGKSLCAHEVHTPKSVGLLKANADAGEVVDGAKASQLMKGVRFSSGSAKPGKT